MLQKILPKTIAMQTYLVTSVVITVLMAVIGYLYADEMEQNILLSQERKLIEIVTVLSERLNSDGLMARYEQAANAPDETTLQEARASLQPIVEAVGQQYPGFAMGYSLSDRRLAMYPYRAEFIRKPYSPDITDEYREKRTLDIATDFQSTLSDELSMRIRYPIIKDEKTIGHIWSTIPMTRVNGAVYQAWLDIVFILLAVWIALLLILTKVFRDTGRTLAELADKIATQDDKVYIQKVPQLQSVFRAVTTLRDSLQDKERAFRTLTENSPDRITRRDTTGQMVYENLSSVKHREITDSYVISGRNYSTEAFCQHMGEWAKNVAASDSSAEFEYKMNSVSGKTKYFKCTLLPEKDETGQVVSVLAVSRDITDIKEAGELFLAAFSLSPNCMMVTRQSDHTIIRVNDTFTQITGLSPDTIEGRTTEELDMWPDKDRFDEMYNLMMKQGYLSNHEVQYLARGKIRTALLSTRQITINGEPCWLHVSTDITEKKALMPKSPALTL